MILMPQIFDVIANVNACYKHNELEFDIYDTHYFTLFSVGNKNDMDNLREVNLTDAKSFAQHHGMLDAIETSAKDNNNIEAVFLAMAKVRVLFTVTKF